jgi:hypothetical protein
MKNPWDVLRGRELPVVVFWCYCMAGIELPLARYFKSRGLTTCNSLDGK